MVWNLVQTLLEKEATILQIIPGEDQFFVDTGVNKNVPVRYMYGTGIYLWLLMWTRFFK
jgi:hypothetical protein